MKKKNAATGFRKKSGAERFPPKGKLRGQCCAHYTFGPDYDILVHTIPEGAMRKMTGIPDTRDRREARRKTAGAGKICFAVLLLALFLLAARGGFADEFALPEKSSVFSKEFALRMLAFSSGYGEADTERILTGAGFEPVLRAHYDKAAEDPAHTCAFMLGKKILPDGRRVFLLVIRGTYAGEWYSNFDVAPSGSGDTPWAENFLHCAEDVLLRIRESLASDPEAVWVVTGHSRGAACANVLGLMLNSLRDPELNYIYTSATPATLRGDPLPLYAGNIFNLINPMDLVPKLPLEAWGYRRAGEDILLPGYDQAAAQLDVMTDTLASLAPTLRDYYTARHLLTGPGTGEEGLTAFDILTLLAERLTNLTLKADGSGGYRAEMPGSGVEGISPESDLYPLFEMLQILSGDSGQRLLEQHLPAAYEKLLRMRK